MGFVWVLCRVSVSQPTEISDVIMTAIDTGDLPFAWHVTLSDLSV